MVLLDRATVLRMRRLFRRRQRQVEAVSTQASTNFDRHFIDRFERLLDVKRFVVGWVFLLVTITVLTSLQTVGLNQYFLKVGPKPGGTYNEGMVGAFSNANPIFATGPVDTSISRLLFAGLFKYNDDNKLVGDLARSYDSDESGKLYTVHLKPNLQWHDGAALTSKDVAYTFSLIQNPDVHSPLFSSWQGVKVQAIDSSTITFQLPGALTAFPYSLTQGILPEHILRTIPASKLRSAAFNTSNPIGAGPFQWDALQLNNGAIPGSANALISLKAFQAYNTGAPKLEGYVLHVYDDVDQMFKSYAQHTIEAMSGVKEVPAELVNDESTYTYQFATTAAKMVFFKLDAPVLNDVEVRRALVMGTDQTAVLRALGGHLHPVREPILLNQVGYDKAYEQAGFDIEKANAALDKAGWVRSAQGIRSKNNLPLKFQIAVEDNVQDRKVMKVLQASWSRVGAEVEPLYQQTTDFQGTVEGHSYAALLYGISIGPDPDVFVYWHSSQTAASNTSRLNFSEYKSSTADPALEAGRTRQDQAVRALKYKPFLKAWQEDAPAVGLYQPNILYVTRGQLSGLNPHVLNVDADRYYSVENWTVKTGHVPK